MPSSIIIAFLIFARVACSIRDTSGLLLGTLWHKWIFFSIILLLRAVLLLMVMVVNHLRLFLLLSHLEIVKIDVIIVIITLNI
jgi:hypothetical protein